MVTVDAPVKAAGTQETIDKDTSSVVEKVPDAQPYTHLEYLVKNTTTCCLKPLSFFVSWQGVLTLTYRGFPVPLVHLKEDIGQYYSSLPKENPGSKWPKTSLGALKDGKRLTPQQLERLQQICREESGIFQNPQCPRKLAVLIDSLSLVMFECRCLERLLLRHDIPLIPSAALEDPEEEEQARVEAVLAEGDHQDYWFHASRDGSRESHYRVAALGATLVHPLACFNPHIKQHPDSWSAALPGVIRQLRKRVDAELPGMYSWFSDTSLHITVRGLMG